MARSIQDLMEDAYEKLDVFDSKEALVIGKKLVAMQYSGGFEIMALAYLQSDKLERAIKVLKEGVAQCPDVWVLWQLLGNCYSDNDNYDEAINSYRQALECPGANPSSIHLNTAISLSRQDLYDASNLELSLVTDNETQPRRESLRLANLIGLQRYDDVIEEAPRVAAIIETEHAEDASARLDIGRIYARMAEAFLHGPNDLTAAKDASCRALVYDKTNESALEVLRSINARARGERDKIFRILVEGQWNEPFEGEDVLPKFYTTYWVLAATDQEALLFAGELEPDEVGSSLRIEDSSTEPAAKWQTLKGVYSRSGYAFFDDDEEVKG